MSEKTSPRDSPTAGEPDDALSAAASGQVGPAAASPTEPVDASWTAFARSFASSRLAIIGLALVIVMVLFCFVGPLVYHTDQIHTALGRKNLSPSGNHPLGTDGVGYDVLGRLMVAGQVSLEVGVAAAVLSTIFGALWGAIAGFFGGWLDSVMMRIVDSIYSIPPLLLLMLLASMFRRTTVLFIIVLSVVSWLPTARLARGDTLVVRVREYIEASRSFGTRRVRIIMRHVLRNIVSTLVVQATLQIAIVILLLASLSFLGMGPPPPATSWGEMLNSGLNYLYDGYWWLIYPAGVCILLVVLGFSFIGEGVRNAVDIRLRR